MQTRTFVHQIAGRWNDDTASVGGKSPTRGELVRFGVPTMWGFTRTSVADDDCWNRGLNEPIHDLPDDVDASDVSTLHVVESARRMTALERLV